jgi:hypothetical protein
MEKMGWRVRWKMMMARALESILMMRVMVVWRMVVMVVGGCHVMRITRHGRCVHQHRGKARFRIYSNWFHHSVVLVLVVHPGIWMRMNVARSGKNRRCFRQDGRNQSPSSHIYVF